MDNAQFSTVDQLAAKFPAFTTSSLRWLLYNRKRNGLASAVVSLGRKILIDEAAFVAWLRSQRQTDRPTQKHERATPKRPIGLRKKNSERRK